MDAETTLDTTCQEDAINSTQNSTMVDITHTSTASSNPSCSAALDEVSSMYKQQVMASSNALEAKYQTIVKDMNKKLKNERIQRHGLEKEIHENKLEVENTRKLERELKANSTVLQSVKKELDISNRSLEKSIISQNQREHDFIRIRGEYDEIEKKNFELKRSLQDKDAALTLSNEELVSRNDYVTSLQNEYRETKHEYEEREAAMREDTQTQFTEMQEDMAILVGRMTEMSAIKQKYETTEKNYEIAVQENKILVATMAELKRSLVIELEAVDSCKETIAELGREGETLEEHIKKLDNEKWAGEAALEKVQEQLKTSRVVNLDLKKQMDKKEKILHHMGNNLGKAEKELKSMEKMYKAKLVENGELKDRVKVISGLEESVEKKEREMQSMDSQIDQLETSMAKLYAKLESTEQTHKAELSVLGGENAKLQNRLNSVNNQHESTEISVCELKIKIQQLTDEQITFQAARRQFENELAEQSSMREQADHNAKRLQRKQDFLQDELDQFKLQYDKERSKFEQATRDNINLQDQVASLRSQIDTITIQLHDSEHRNNKTASKSDRMKEKIKTYQRNLSDAHCEEVDQLHGTIQELQQKLTEKEKAFRGKGDNAVVPEEKSKKRETHRISELEQTISEIQHKMIHLESENKSLESMLDTKKRPRENSPKVRPILKERPELSKLIHEDTIISEAGEEDKENKKPRSKQTSEKKPAAKKARVALQEKKNDTTLAPRTTRTRQTHNKTIF